MLWVFYTKFYESCKQDFCMVVEFLSFLVHFCCQAYLFNDYWEDIGTIKSFFDSNLALTEQVTSINSLALITTLTTDIVNNYRLATLSNLESIL